MGPCVRRDDAIFQLNRNPVMTPVLLT